MNSEESTRPQIWRVHDFDDWRTISRTLLQQGIPPADVIWECSGDQPSLMSARTADAIPDHVTSTEARPTVPRNFLQLAESVACHCDAHRWRLLYSALWRMNHGERHLLELASDDLTSQLVRMHRQVRRDCHKMKAFVRFTKVAEQPHETFLAWYHPDHNIVRLVAPFFSRRFRDMEWTIMTPLASAHWDREQLTYGQGLDSKTKTPQGEDELVTLWREYYRSTFNPARVKTKAMKREMPVRFWHNLPETSIIDDLLRDAPSRVASMHAHAQPYPKTAQEWIPHQGSLDSLNRALATCDACDLCHNGTRVVPGSGPATARLMIVGEQPGDVEEQTGVPFSGPAGELLDRLLRTAGIDRTSVYITNVVKHFHHKPQGKRRLHQRPAVRHEIACKPWLEAEVDRVKPHIVLGLGVTAQRALLGRHKKLEEVIGQSLPSWACEQTFIAWHPASILRTTATLAAQRERDLLQILRIIRSRL